MRQLSTVLLVAAALIATPVAAEDPPAQEPPAQPAEEPKVEMNDLEKKFERTMSGATLVGRFTVEGQGDPNKPPAEERYVISKVTKIGQDRWMFVARIGEAKVPVPLPLPVKWAGDTPVISVTKLKVPGMGTYSARVLIYDGHYAGTWDAGDHGGHMWGRIEREGEKKGDDKAAPKAPPQGGERE